MPYPRKPNNLKILSGSNLPLRDNVEFLEVPKIPDPPDWLMDADAIIEYHRLAPILFGVGILNEANTVVLCHLCAIHGKLLGIWREGGIPTGHLIAQYRNLVNDFGMTPSSQTKIKPSKDGKSANKFASNKRAMSA